MGKSIIFIWNIFNSKNNFNEILRVFKILIVQYFLFSLFFIDDGTIVEVINAVTGKCNTGNVSRLSKQMFFIKFHELLRKKIPTKTGITLETAPEVYSDAKELVENYKVILK